MRIFFVACAIFVSCCSAFLLWGWPSDFFGWSGWVDFGFKTVFVAVPAYLWWAVWDGEFRPGAKARRAARSAAPPLSDVYLLDVLSSRRLQGRGGRKALLTLWIAGLLTLCASGWYAASGFGPALRDYTFRSCGGWHMCAEYGSRWHLYITGILFGVAAGFLVALRRVSRGASTRTMPIGDPYLRYALFGAIIALWVMSSAFDFLSVQ